ncbi:MAG: hypothetical protein KDH96_10290, partial [Candidatus Riesia sp.]|nr:hypothetical protein [Candidatus Riesia sp.]
LPEREQEQPQSYYSPYQQSVFSSQLNQMNQQTGYLLQNPHLMRGIQPPIEAEEKKEEQPSFLWRWINLKSLFGLAIITLPLFLNK